MEEPEGFWGSGGFGDSVGEYNRKYAGLPPDITAALKKREAGEGQPGGYRPTGPGWVPPGRGDPALIKAGCLVNQRTDAIWCPEVGSFMLYPNGTIFIMDHGLGWGDRLVFPRIYWPDPCFPNKFEYDLGQPDRPPCAVGKIETAKALRFNKFQ